MFICFLCRTQVYDFMFVCSQTVKRMSFPNFALAFDKYAMAAAMIEQWTYAASKAHFENCLKVAGESFWVCFYVFPFLMYVCIQLVPRWTEEPSRWVKCTTR